MDILQPYVGQHCTAKSASQDIDIDTIFAACDEIDARISVLGPMAGEIGVISRCFDEDSLSVDGATMLSSLFDYKDSMETSQKDVESITQTIRECVVQRYNEIQQYYNDSAKATDERINGYG